MKLLITFIIGGVIVYFLLKFCLLVYRPFYLARMFREIEQMYDKVLNAAEKDVRSAVANLELWQSGDIVLRMLNSEDKLKENVKDSITTKAHEVEVHEKSLRLRERFILDHSKLSESIIAYRRYLDVRLMQRQDAAVFAKALTTDVMTFDEFVALATKTKIVLEENERKLDALLS